MSGPTYFTFSIHPSNFVFYINVFFFFVRTLASMPLYDAFFPITAAPAKVATTETRVKAIFLYIYLSRKLINFYYGMDQGLDFSYIYIDNWLDAGYL